MEEYDIAVIGAGPGGYIAALHAAKLGFKVVCIDKRQELGGTCLNVGCIPSKALLQSSEHYAFIQQKAQQHGIENAGLTLNFPQMMERKKEIVQGLVNGIKGLFTRAGITHLCGQGSFVSPHEIAVGEQRIKAEHVIIATGSEPIPLPFLPFDEQKILSSTGALDLPEIPQEMVVIGAGVIGVELASVYQRLGTRVTLVEMLDHICPGMDETISKGLLTILKRQGLSFHLSTRVNEASRQGEKIYLDVIHQGQKIALESDVVLVSVGRRPYTQGLNLHNIGVETTPEGLIQVDGNFRTKQHHIYALGDVIAGPMLAHRASDEGVAVVDLIAGKQVHINYLALPNVIYTHPEVAAVGLSEKEALQLNLSIRIGTVPFKANPRARCSGDTEGFVKLIAEKQTDRLIGMHIIGPHASELIAEGVIAIEKGATLKELAYAAHAHPTLSEAIKEAAYTAQSLKI